MSSQTGNGFLKRLFSSDPAPTTRDGEVNDATEAEAPSDQAALAEVHDQTTATPSEENKGEGGWFSRLQSGLSKTSQNITSGIAGIFTKSKLDELKPNVTLSITF